MTSYTFNLPKALNSYPEHTVYILQEAEKIKNLSAECGCSMGGKFMLVSFSILIFKFIYSGNFLFPKILIDIFIGLVVILISTAVGKMIGIGLAKFRLALLYKKLQSRYPL